MRVVRSGLEESVHLGHVAVCDADGALLASAGDPDRLVYARSCMKPLQGAVSLSALESERLPDREVAVICASHNGEPIHVRTVRAVLRRAGLGPEALANPPGWPLDEASMVRRRRREPLLHNCSGKHAGMLLACARSGWDVASYVSARHPLQRRILRTVRRASGVDDPVVGVDGCGVPVHGVPLRAMATLYARLARPDRLGDVAPCVARATEAMLAEPYLVGGRRRSDTAIMRETGDVVAKSGAEALECAAAIGPGTGVAVKVEDGGYRAAAPAVVAVLSQLGLLTDAAREALVPFAAPGVTGGGRRIGELRAVVRLRRER